MALKNINMRTHDQNLALARHMAKPGEFGDLAGIAGRNPVVAVGPGGDDYYWLKNFSALDLYQVQAELLKEGYLAYAPGADEEETVQEWTLGPRAQREVTR